ncbi:hypothetical protein [Treponema sp. Marseille-Q4523]|uniref:hypothetical protein n=1 Tax=Treponema sp. Marseille-Q4523 TaxID=2810610 RepID=UPI00195FF12A|nr:hypothetical protein [Treponema sp. Marseille-Q4523]MBM7021867.1 hypothetical protein [Treponema sp. Marseille-Q4523]
MKKTGFKLFAVSLALCFFFGACNFNINGGRELAEVRVGGGGGRAANPETGLPIFDGSNTTITISDASGRLIAEGPLPLSAEVVVGVEIVVKATVQTASGTWSRTKTHTVKAGINDIDLELSKTPNVIGNFFFDVIETIPLSGVKLRLKFRNGKTFPDTIRMGGNYPKPVTARDSLGRLYLLYHDDSVKKFTRFDVDGNEDTGFQTAVAAQLPSSSLPNGISDIDNIAIDQDDNYIFLFNGVNVYCLKENAYNHFTCSNRSSLSTLDPSISTVSAVAAYNGTLFFTVPLSASLPQVNKLFACKVELSGSILTLSNKIEKQLPKVRQDNAFDNNHTECTGLFADEDGVYCLLNEQKLDSGMLYALGQLVRYTYTGSAFIHETKIGLNPAASTADPIAFNAQYFSNPIGFIGYDEDNIYIADDGVGIANGKEGWRVTGEKNRIAAFNRKTGTLTFTDTDATWYAYHAAYPSKKTPALLWEKSTYGMHYWTSTNGTGAFSEANKLFADTSSERPTDVFCYDQDGNLYIVYRDNPNPCFVRRFILGVNGYVKDNDKTLGSLSDISAVAVDISDGKKTLYYSYKTVSNNWFVKSLVWNTDFSSAAFPTPPYEIQTALTEITALAANKDGVFVATKEQTALTAPYTIKVAKYKKGSSPVQDGVITVVSASPAENPSPHPTTGDYERYEEAVRDLQVIDGVLYGISSKTTESRKYVSTHHETDVFKNSSKLYKIGATASTLSGIEKTIGKDANDAAQTGYGFCRFIAVKYDEAERIRLIIASDGVWGTGGTAEPHGDPKNTDKVLEYDLAGNLLVERNSGGSFSQKLTHIVGTGFSWY